MEAIAKGEKMMQQANVNNNKTMNLEIISSEKVLFRGEAKKVTMPERWDLLQFLTIMLR